MPRPSKILTKEDIIRAQKVTRSNMAAARYLHVSYNHYKKYAKMYKNDEGKTLLESHMNQAGEGIPKFTIAGGKEVPLLDLLLSYSKLKSNICSFFICINKNKE